MFTTVYSRDHTHVTLTFALPLTHSLTHVLLLAGQHELLRNHTRSGVQRKLHFTNLLVHLFHELDNKVHQLVLEHLFRMVVCNQETNVIALHSVGDRVYTYLDGLSPQNYKVFGSLHQESSKLVTKDALDVISLLNADTDTDAVYAPLD